MQIKNKKFYHILMWIVLFIIPTMANSQDVVVNEFYNAGNGTDDEIELLVIKDSADIRGWWIKDFSSSNANDGGGRYQFRQMQLWMNLRAGTIIRLKESSITLDTTTGCNDYTIVMSLSNTTYFVTTHGTAMDIATNDMVMLKMDSSSGAGVTGNVHTLRGGSAGTQWNNITVGTRVGTTTTTSSSTSCAVTNSSSVIGDFNLGTSGVTGATSSTLGTFNNTNNENFIKLLRGPVLKAASGVSASGITVNWATLTGATKYYLTVDDDSTFASPISGFNNLDVGTDTSRAVTGLAATTKYFYRLRAQNTTPTLSRFTCWDSVTTLSGTSPNIIVSNTGLSGLDTTVGNISGVKTYTVSGDNLTNDVDLAFTSGDFEMSQTSATTGFGSTLTLARSGTDLTGEPVTIWVRMKSQSATGGVTDTITHTSTGAVTRELALSGTVSAVFYSKSTGNLDDVANWGTNTDGSGTNPANFTSAQCTYNVVNRTNATIGASWTVSGTNSKIVVGDGASATDLEIPAAMTITGTIDLSNLAELTMNHTTLAHTYGTRNANSTLEYAQAGSFTIPQITYHHLKLTNGTKVWAGSTTTIAGNLTYENVTLDAASSNPFSTVNLSGNLTVNGTLTNPSLANSYTFIYPGTSTQTISGNGQQLNFFRLQTTSTGTVQLSDAGGGTSLLLGNTSGGGFSLGAGSTLVLNNNSISTTASTGAVFVAATTGVIRGSANASITINSAASSVGTMYMDQTTPGTTNVLKNFTYNLTHASGTMVLGNELQIAGILTHTDGQLTTGGNLVLRATGATNYGQIAGTGTGTISGNLTANFLVAGGGAGYRPICSPVSGATLAQLSDDYNLDFGSSSSAAANTYYFDESATPYWNIASGTSASMDSRVYSIYMGGSPSWANPLPITMDISGTYQGTSDYSPASLSRTGSIADTMGWHYIRNPWPSGFLWDGTTTTVTGVADIQGQQVWVFNQNDSTYRVYDNSGTGVIPPFTPLVVQAASNGVNITLKNSARYTDSLKNFFDKAGMENYLELTLTDPAGKTDVAKWFTLPEATDGYDNFDGNKRMNIGAPNLYFMLEGNKANKEVWKNIPGSKTPIFLNLQGREQGTYTLQIAKDNFAPGVEAFLTDLSTKKVTKIDGKPYTFAYTPGEAAGRFTLHFSGGISSVSEQAETENVLKVGSNGSDITIIVNRTGNFTATVYDLLGRPVYTKTNLEGSAVANTLSLNGLAAGYYMVNVTGQGISQTQKVNIQQ